MKKLITSIFIVLFLSGFVYFSTAQIPTVLPGSALNDLSDVNAPSPTDGYSLAWDDATSRWTAQDITGGAGSNDKVGVDSGATEGYLGAAYNDGVLRADQNELTYTDGGNFITLGLADHNTARTALGLAIGTDVQAYDADLTTYAGITPSANVQTLLGAANYAAFKTSLSLNSVENTALSTWAGTTNITTLGTIATGVWNGTAVDISSYTNLAVDANELTLTGDSLGLADHATARTALGLAIGTDVEAYDADLTALAANTLQNVSTVDATSEGTIETAIDTLANLASVRAGAAGDVALFGGAASGETPELTIGGFRTGDSLRTLEIGVGTDADDRASFDGVSEYYFDGDVIAGGGGASAAELQLEDASGDLLTIKPGVQSGAVTFTMPTTAGTGLVFSTSGVLSYKAIGTDVQAYDADLATLAGSTAWRVFYSDGSSVITELALGSSGQYLKSNGATSAPTWATPGGTGTVTTVEHGDSGVGDADIVTLDFLAADFVIGEDPDTEINISLDYPNAQKASTSQAGFLTELATTAETSAGTDTTRAITADGLAGSTIGRKTMILKVMAEDTVVTAGDGAMYFTVPIDLNGWDLTAVGAHVYTADTGADHIHVDIYNLTDTADMLSAAMQIEDGEKDTATSATPGTINGATDDVATADEIRIDVTTYAGSSAKGLEIRLTFEKVT